MYTVSWLDNGKLQFDNCLSLMGVSLLVERLIEEAKQGREITDIDIQEIEA